MFVTEYDTAREEPVVTTDLLRFVETDNAQQRTRPNVIAVYKKIDNSFVCFLKYLNTVLS